MAEYEQQEVEIVVTYIPRDNASERVADTIVIRNSNNVGELKAIIERDHSLHIPADQQILLHYTSNSLLLDDDEKLDTLAAELGEHIKKINLYRRIEPQDVPVRVKIDPAQIHRYPDLPDGHQMEFTVSTRLLLSDLKKMIDAEIGISPRRQLLVYWGWEPPEDYRLDRLIVNVVDLQLTVSEMLSDPELTLEFSLELADGRLENFPMAVYDTIYSLRGIIRRSGYLQQPLGEFSLYKHGENDEEPLAGHSTLEELGITGETTVFIEEEGGVVLD